MTHRILDLLAEIADIPHGASSHSLTHSLTLTQG